jgi:predicted ABC-type ATPase
METRPQVVIIGGPNGAGKSTIARTVVSSIGLTDFVNADVIARGLSAMHPESVAMEAARIMLERLKKLAAAKKDFAFETTLAARTYAPWIRDLRQEGWIFRLIYVTLRSPDLAVERVKSRIAEGGHSIPEEDIRRRFVRAVENFHRLYMPLADEWAVYENTLPGLKPRLIASGGQGQPPSIIELDLWKQFCETGHAHY